MKIRLEANQTEKDKMTVLWECDCNGKELLVFLKNAIQAALHDSPKIAYAALGLMMMQIAHEGEGEEDQE